MILNPTVYQFLVGVFAALGSFLYGYDLTIVAEGQSVPLRHRHKIQAENLDSGVQSIFLE